MKYQNLLARAGEVSKDAIHRALEELWTTPVAQKDTFDLPEGATLDDLYTALRYGNEGKSRIQAQIEGAVTAPTSMGLKEGVTPTEFYEALKGAKRDPQDIVWTEHDGLGGCGWPRLASPQDREDYLKANLKDYGGQTSSQVAPGIGDENPKTESFDVAPEPGQTVQIAPEPTVSKGPLFDPAKMRHVPDQREVNIPHRPETPVDTTETDTPTDSADTEDPFPGETLEQAVGRIQTVLKLYPTAPRFGVSGPHPGLCKGTADGCAVCGFERESGDHCHAYEVCPDCLGFGEATCGTARKIEAFAAEVKAFAVEAE